MKRDESQHEAKPLHALRVRAEALLVDMTAEAETICTEDIKTLLHELSVYQIELEMQNEELRQAQGDLAQSRDRYADLYEFAPVGYVTLDAKGMILEANLAAAATLGVSRHELLRSKISRFVSPASQDDLYLYLRAILRWQAGHGTDDDVDQVASNSVQYLGPKQVVELGMRRADGSSMTMRLESIPCECDGAECCRTAMIDITVQEETRDALQKLNNELETRVANRTAELEQASRHLEETSRWLQSLLDRVDVIVSDWQMPFMRPTFVSRRAEEILGYPVEEWFEKPGFWQEVVLPQHVRDQIVGFCSRETAAGRDHNFIYPARHADGQTVWIHEFVTVRMDACGDAVNLTCVMVDITERKEAEERLEASHSRLKNVLEVGTVGVMFWDLGTGCLTDANDTFLELTGYTRREVESGELNWRAEAPLSHRSGRKGAFEEIQEKGKISPSEIRWLRKDGSSRWLVFAGSALDDGTCVEFCVDVSDQKRAEEALRKSEERLRSILHTAADAIISMDSRGRINDVNPATVRMFGASRDELVGQNFTTLVSQEMRDAGFFQKMLDECRDTISQEITCTRKNKSTFPVDISVSKVDHLDLFTGVLRDISERKESEERLQRELHFTENLVNTARHVVLVLDPKGHILRFNPYFRELTGWSLDDVKGRDWFEMAIPEYDRERVRDEMIDAVNRGQPCEYMQMIVTKEGRELEIAWANTPLSGSDGKSIGILCTGLDVTERRVMEREIIEISAEEQRRIGNELHDGVCQQLTGLGLLAQGIADVVSGQFASTSQETADLPFLLDGVRKLSSGIGELTEQVRYLSHGLIPVDIDAQGLMSSIEELVKSVNSLPGVSCDFTCSKIVGLTSNFVATHIYRIAQEAIANALKHSFGDHINVSLDEEDGAIVLSVADDGHGIVDPAIAMTHGLGLRIMKYRADLIGAALVLESGPSGGTRITCRWTEKKISTVI